MNLETINNIFDEIILPTHDKCWTNNQIKEKLREYTQGEKNNELSNKLNLAEKDHYNYLQNKISELDKVIKEHKDYLKEHKGDSLDSLVERLLSDFRSDKKNLEELIFNYEKRIFNNYKPHLDGKAPEVNINDYRQDNEIISDEWASSMDVKLGNIENEIINNQRNINLTDENYSALKDYFNNGYSLVNSRLNNGNTWNRLNSTEKKHQTTKLNNMEKNLSEAISKSEGLPYNVQVFHSGVFDVSKVVGDKIKFKGFTSTSFQQNVAEEWFGERYTDKGLPAYTYRILCDTNTKGICANDNSKHVMTMHRDEHELLLDKGLEGTIVNVDVTNHIVTVLPD